MPDSPSERDRLADDRDHQADQRDRDADERERQADMRDRIADERDRQAEDHDETNGDDSVEAEAVDDGWFGVDLGRNKPPPPVEPDVEVEPRPAKAPRKSLTERLAEAAQDRDSLRSSEQ